MNLQKRCDPSTGLHPENAIVESAVVSMQRQMHGTQVSSRTLVIHTLPGLVFFLSVLLIVGFLTLILSVLASGHLIEALAHPNPFAAYEVFWPGQLIDTATDYARLTTDNHLACMSEAQASLGQLGIELTLSPSTVYQAEGTIYCQRFLDDGIFRRLLMRIEKKRIQELQLFSKGLQQDTLFLYWGTPDAITKSGNDRFWELYWERSTYSAMATVIKTNSIVTLVTLTANAQDN